MGNVEKKIDLNKIIESMYQKFGKDGLSELEKARYLYLELGKLLRFDVNYISISKYKQEECYYKPVNYDDIATNSYVCVQMANMYAEILRRVGIDAEILNTESGDQNYEFIHKYTSVKLKNGRKIIADLAYDLPYIQEGMKTQNFGTNTEWGHSTISEEDLKEIDDKIKYTYSCKEGHRDYTEFFLEMIKKEMQNEENIKDFLRGAYSEEESGKYKPELLIKYKFDIISRFFPLENMGFREGRKLLNILFTHFFTEQERRKNRL